MFKAQSYDEIFGQDHIIKTLENMNFLGKSLFFAGERGTGKTSMAKIIANEFTDSEYNIEHLNCGRFPDVASMRKKTDEFNKSSIYGSYKCYIFDEPQRLSKPAMDSLLIPIENLNINTCVILCSMEPEKVEPALSDRFIKFRTKLLDKKTSMELLDYVCKKEEVVLDKFKKMLIVEKCDGNPRLIINSIPKIQHINDKKDIEYLLDVGAISDDEDILELYKLILNGVTWDKIRYLLNELLKSKSPDSIRMGILNLIGNGLLRGFGSGKEKRMIHIFNVLEKSGIPEKAHLVTKIGEICLGERIGIN